jgi:hypothetical protein
MSGRKGGQDPALDPINGTRPDRRGNFRSLCRAPV